MLDSGLGGVSPGRVPSLGLYSGSNKITPRSAVDARWDAGLVAPGTPRLKTNKISSTSARSHVTTCSEEDPHVVCPKGSPSVGRRASPRAASARSSPRQDLPRAATPPAAVASLAEIKSELLGLEMRRLIREELRSVLSERQGTDSKTLSYLRPGLVPAPDTGGGEHTNFHDGAENMLGLHDREVESLGTSSVGSKTSGHLTSRGAHPSNLYKSVLSMLEVSVHELTSWDRCMLAVQQRLSSLGKESAPPRTDPLSRIADSCAFELTVHVVIILNVACMAFQADHDITSKTYVFDQFFRVMEIVFLLFYLFEFVVKFARLRWVYFYGVGYGWNWVDFMVLVFSVPFALQIDGAMGALPAKIIRMLRLTRALRVLQLVSFFKKMSALINSLTATVSTLICSLSMLAVFLFMFSLFFVMRIALVLKDAGSDLSAGQRGELLASFGSILVSMLTLLKVCTGGTDWSEVLEVLEAIGWETQAIFVAFIAFSQMALLNIVLGLFVEQAMKSMASDKLELAHRHFQEQSEFKTTIHDLFHMTGIDTAEKITLSQWRTCPQKHRLYSYLDFHGFQPNEVDQYLELLSNTSEDGAVDVNHFVNGCIRMKGGASSFSVYEVLLAVSELHERVNALLEQVQSGLISKKGSFHGHGGAHGSSPKGSGLAATGHAETPGGSSFRPR